MNCPPSSLPTVLLRSAAVSLCLFALAGCATVKGWMGGGGDDGKVTDPAELVDFAATASPSRLWTHGAGKGEGRLGLRQRPAVLDGRVYVAAVTGGVQALDLQTGAVAWRHASDLQVSGGPGAGDGLVVFGGLEGDVVALDAASGGERWRAKVGNEVIAAPVIGQGMVFVRSNDGRVTAFDAGSGERRWFWNHDLPTLTVRGNDAPVLGPGLLFVGNDDGSVAALAVADGRPLWEQSVAQAEGRTELERMADVDGTPVLDGSLLYATSFKGQTMAIDAPSGRPIWARDTGGAGRAGVGGQHVVVADRSGVVSGLDRDSGSSMWSQAGLARREVSGVAIHGDHAVVGDFEGYLHWMRLDTGEFAGRTRAGRDPVRTAPVVSDGVLVAQDIGGTVSAWRLAE